MNILILGGTGNLGSEVYKELSEHNIVFTYHNNKQKADELANSFNATALQLDILSIPQIKEVIEKAGEHLGGIDAFINCVGVGANPEHKLADITEDDFDNMIAVNTKGVLFACQAVVNYMDEGNIILISSIDGEKPMQSAAHYTASNSALKGMVMSMSKELGDKNVKVNMITSGIMEGGLSSSIPANLIDDYKEHCGLKKLANSSEIASVISWFATNNTYITGQSIVVDGAL